MIPRPNTISSRFEAAMDTKKFFQVGWNLIESENAGTRQHVITKLGAGAGLGFITKWCEMGTYQECCLELGRPGLPVLGCAKEAWQAKPIITKGTGHLCTPSRSLLIS